MAVIQDVANEIEGVTNKASEVKSMYVCLCRGITDSQIKEAVNEGACSIRELRASLGVASQCGKCSHATKQILQESLLSAPGNLAGGNFYALT